MKSIAGLYPRGQAYAAASEAVQPNEVALLETVQACGLDLALRARH